MRYFKSFFKHTWHPQQMENVGRYNGSRHCEAHRAEETELGELRNVTTSGVSGPTGSLGTAGVSCYDGACKSNPRRQPVHRLESPWHHLKTVFLISIIISFVVWLVAYVLLAQYGFL